MQTCARQAILSKISSTSEEVKTRLQSITTRNKLQVLELKQKSYRKIRRLKNPTATSRTRSDSVVFPSRVSPSVFPPLHLLLHLLCHLHHLFYLILVYLFLVNLSWSTPTSTLSSTPFYPSSYPPYQSPPHYSSYYPPPPPTPPSSIPPYHRPSVPPSSSSTFHRPALLPTLSIPPTTAQSTRPMLYSEVTAGQSSNVSTNHDQYPSRTSLPPWYSHPLPPGLPGLLPGYVPPFPSYLPYTSLFNQGYPFLAQNPTGF